MHSDGIFLTNWGVSVWVESWVLYEFPIQRLSEKTSISQFNKVGAGSSTIKMMHIYRKSIVFYFYQLENIFWNNLYPALVVGNMKCIWLKWYKFSPVVEILTILHCDNVIKLCLHTLIWERRDTEVQSLSSH